MTDPFLIRAPAKLASDPELGPYFNFMDKVLHDLTVTAALTSVPPTGGSKVTNIWFDVVANEIVVEYEDG